MRKKESQLRISFKLKDWRYHVMPLEPLCRNKIFKDIPNYDDIKDPHMMDLFSSVFTGMSGRYTRMRIICAITEEPLNARELSKKLKLDYKTIQHNIKVLEDNSLIVRVGEGYGDLFFPSDLISSNLPTLYKVIKKVEDKIDKSEKKYID
jgi:DNA-binding transcriptional ArsR family regulator